MIPERALAVYGTLAPGESNHHVLLGVDGQWIDGYIRGYMFDVTWGGAEGYPGVVLDNAGNLISVRVLVSDQLDKHWDRLDRFEGPGYRRIPVEVLDRSESGDVGDVIGTAFVFEALTHND